VGGVLLVAAVFVLCVWAPWGPREPVYDGKALSYWLSYSPPRTGSIPASFEFDPVSPDLARKIVADENAVPFLVKAMVGHDRRLGNAYFRTLARLPRWIERLLPPPPNNGLFTRARAATLLVDIGAIAKATVPDLIRGLKKDEDYHLRRLAALALGNLGEGDSNAVTAVTAALCDNHVNVRMAATNALWRLDYEAAVKAGINPRAPDTLKDKKASVRMEAAYLLGQKGERNRAAAVAALTEALNDQAPEVREAATNAFRRLDPEAAANAGVKVPSP
jgi:hypothetical protein